MNAGLLQFNLINAFKEKPSDRALQVNIKWK